MNVHSKVDGTRYSKDQIIDMFFSETACVLIDGFVKIADQGDARSDQTRTAGFMECGQMVDYTIPQNARKPLSFITNDVSLHGAKKAAFCFSMGFGNGSPLPQPSGKYNIYVNDVFCLAIRNVNYSFFWRGEGSEFAFSMRRCETSAPYTGMHLSSMIQNEHQAAFGIGILVVNSEFLQDNQPAKITIEPISEYQSTRYFYLGTTPNIVSNSNIWSAIELLKTKNIKKSGGYNVYYGDIHTHSGQVRSQKRNQGCGMNSMDDNYMYAKGPGGLHFYALTDHEFQILPDYEEPYFALSDIHNKDGEFVCLKAFEHTSAVYGHRNIYFRKNAKIVDVTDENGTPTHPQKMMELLAGYEFFSIPHHPSSASHPCNTKLLYDEDVCFEVYSSWGSSEYWGDFPRGVSDRHDHYWVNELLATGAIIGLVASSDGHDGHPGNAQSPYPKHQHLFHFCGSGLTAVLCESLTRENVYEAIKNRRCYGTTGAPIHLEIDCGGALMGSVIKRHCLSPTFDITCRGTNSIKEVRIVKNGRIHYVHPCCGMWDVSFSYTDTAYDGSNASYYVRVVQSDMESAWSSPFFFREK